MPMLAFTIKAFVTLFVVIDPVGLVPIFIALAGNYSEEEQASILRQAILIAGIILLVFSLGGNFLLHYLGITIEAFQVTAGLLLLKLGLDMVFGESEGETKEEDKQIVLKRDISVFPLAIPLIAGPGTLASTLILLDEASTFTFAVGLAIVLTINVILLGVCYGFLSCSKYLASVLGATGINAVTRILGVLLSALGVQYMADGLVVLLKLGS
ncbi:MarC family protein [Ancylothrix sp. D3o]|uniref:MarC family protein n=1 Tax=Ancylothrix sp. D3o TaxID=2953691 RepID=UPI0021BAA08D|nr:MarC family protein [Ancylothrix sp. D3o]